MSEGMSEGGSTFWTSEERQKVKRKMEEWKGEWVSEWVAFFFLFLFLFSQSAAPCCQGWTGRSWSSATNAMSVRPAVHWSRLDVTWRPSDASIGRSPTLSPTLSLASSIRTHPGDFDVASRQSPVASRQSPAVEEGKLGEEVGRGGEKGRKEGRKEGTEWPRIDGKDGREQDRGAVAIIAGAKDRDARDRQIDRYIDRYDTIRYDTGSGQKQAGKDLGGGRSWEGIKEGRRRATDRRCKRVTRGPLAKEKRTKTDWRTQPGQKWAEKRMWTYVVHTEVKQIVFWRRSFKKCICSLRIDTLNREFNLQSEDERMMLRQATFSCHQTSKCVRMMFVGRRFVRSFFLPSFISFVRRLYLEISQSRAKTKLQSYSFPGTYPICSEFQKPVVCFFWLRTDLPTDRLKEQR